jgi:Mn2+/Fe2+ NRAMP family transporter
MTELPKSTKKRSVLVSAAFLMATSAIGPGFLTQTASFTNTLLASFGFVIIISILLDIGAQLTVWKILCASGMRAQELANKVIPGSGALLSVMILLGGLAFNTGNLAGAGLGLEVLTGWPPKVGAAISALIALFIFWQKDSLPVC